MKPLSPPRRQRGIVTALAAILLFAGVIYWLQQTYGILGNTSQSNATQLDSMKAFFLAESGLERAMGQLKAAADPSAQTACAGVAGGPYTLATGETFTLTAVAGDCTGSPASCTSCTVTSTGNVGDAARTVQSVISVTAPSGGAFGCGGGGIDPATCPVGAPASDIHKEIKQSITLEAGRHVLFSAMGFTRHPAGPTNTVNGNTCIAEPGGGDCTTQWDTQSNTGSGSVVVGSRGSAIVVNPTTTTTYELTQTLTADSLFAAIGAKFGGTGSGNPRIVGQYDTPAYPYPNSTPSYWDDASANGNATIAGNTTASGKTNDGAACAVPDGTAACPNGTGLPQPPTYGTKQAGKNWCSGADTLVFGFTGKSATNNNGALSSFHFGTAPESTDLGDVAYPRPAAGVNSELYTALRYVYNPDYLSTYPPGSAGASSFPLALRGSLGATFAGRIFNGSNALCVATASVTGQLSLNDRITGSNRLGNLPAGCTGGTCICTNCSSIDAVGVAGTPPCLASETHYTLANTSSNNDSASFTAASTNLYVTGVTPTGGAPTAGEPLFQYVAGAADINLGNLDGVASPYTVTNRATALDQYFYQGTSSSTITLPAGSPLPAATGIKVAVFSGLGRFGQATVSGTTFSSWRTVGSVGGNGFAVDAVDAEGIIGATVCGGICAFFNHDAALNSGLTNFTIAIANTNQWAAGMTCLQGVNPDDIEVLKASSTAVTMSSWHEVVR